MYIIYKFKEIQLVNIFKGTAGFVRYVAFSKMIDVSLLFKRNLFI